MALRRKFSGCAGAGACKCFLADIQHLIDVCYGDYAQWDTAAQVRPSEGLSASDDPCPAVVCCDNGVEQR